MAPGSKFKNAELILPCEWKECSFVGKCMEEFCNHIAEHLEEYLQHPLKTAEQYQCWWRSCEFGAKDPRALITHVNFHSYHTKLKFIGSQLRALHHDLPACLQNSRSWHQLPKTSEEFVCHWENCDVTFNNPVWFYQHVVIHAYATEEETVAYQKKAVYCHWKEQIFVCQNCQKHFANERLLRNHMRGCGPQIVPTSYTTTAMTCWERILQHPSTRKHVMLLLDIQEMQKRRVNHVMCALCHVVCTSVSSLKAHIRFRHCDEHPFHCHLCDSSFKNAYDLHKHVETHNDSDAYSCDVEGCGFTSQTLQTLRRHYKRAHVSNGILKYKCHICQKCFSWSYTLTLHLRKAHELSSHSRFIYKEDGEGHMSLHLAVHNAVTDLGQDPTNRMVTSLHQVQTVLEEKEGNLAKETLQQQKYFSHS